MPSWILLRIRTCVTSFLSCMPVFGTCASHASLQLRAVAWRRGKSVI